VIILRNVAKVKYLGRMVTNTNYVHEEVKDRFSMGNACYHAVLNCNLSVA
jgi:hypothetical protein